MEIFLPMKISPILQADIFSRLTEHWHFEHTPILILTGLYLISLLIDLPSPPDFEHLRGQRTQSIFGTTLVLTPG